jgi:hypothetical protein
MGNDPQPRRTTRRRLWPLLAAGVLVIGIVWTVRSGGAGRPYEPQPPTFQGASDSLASTVIVESLDAPFPPGRNAIWCAGFNLAWHRLGRDVIGGPVEVAGAADIARRLNASPVSEADLLPESCFVAAGENTDEVVAGVRRAFAARFPSEPLPEISADVALFAYAYISAAVRFAVPFFDNPAEFGFTDSTGGRTAVDSFGIRPEDEYAYERLRDQVAILYARKPPAPAADQPEDTAGLFEFVLDPCRTSAPYQVVLAAVPRGETLAATLADVESRMQDWSSRSGAAFGPRDVLLIPNMVWTITHHYAALEGPDRLLLNPGFGKLWIATAQQTISFRLDRSGAELRSESRVHCKPRPTHYVFDRPFLIYLKMRGAATPFFVMWVDNAELLSAADPAPR